MAALLGCVHYDLGDGEEAEAARQAAYQWARQAGHSEIMGWAYEMSAWFALVEGRYEQLIEFAQAGQGVAGAGSVVLGDNDRAEEHAREVIAQHGRLDGSSIAPMRTSQAQMNLGIVAARRGELDEAVAFGENALRYERQSLGDLLNGTADLDRILQQKYRGEQLARDFHDRHLHIRLTLESRGPGRL